MMSILNPRPGAERRVWGSRGETLAMPGKAAKAARAHSGFLGEHFCG